MITTLSIKNYALIEDIHVQFSSGLTIITGETGAGKSILLGALGLVIGKRADLKVARDAGKKCIIEAEFSIANYKLKSLFKEHDLDYEAHTILRRELLPSGKSRAFVNDTPVTLHQMQVLGNRLIDIHSQNDTQTLATESYQLSVLDALAANAPLLQSYRKSLQQYQILVSELQDLRDEKELQEKEIDYNTFLSNELAEVQLSKLDQVSLEEGYEKLNNAEEIQEALVQVDVLLADEDSGSVSKLNEARSALNSVKTFSIQYAGLWERLHSTILELEDISDEIEGAIDDIAVDPKQLAETQQILQVLYKLQQKHGVSTVDELVLISQELEKKIEASSSMDDRIDATESLTRAMKQEVQGYAKQLTEARIKVAPLLKSQLENLLSGLGLPHAQFKFELTSIDELRVNGATKLSLLFTANKGVDFGVLHKVASGGEMSRIMLAVKAVLSKYKNLPTLLFDEIDTGVSGEIAHKMAEIMNQMSKEMQLFSITHLPQIAAKGDYHKKVYKTDDASITATHIKDLNPDERIIEIAQMIGGSFLSESAIAHAKQLLN